MQHRWGPPATLVIDHQHFFAGALCNQNLGSAQNSQGNPDSRRRPSISAARSSRVLSRALPRGAAFRRVHQWRRLGFPPHLKPHQLLQQLPPRTRPERGHLQARYGYRSTAHAQPAGAHGEGGSTERGAAPGRVGYERAAREHAAPSRALRVEPLELFSMQSGERGVAPDALSHRPASSCGHACRLASDSMTRVLLRDSATCALHPIRSERLFGRTPCPAVGIQHLVHELLGVLAHGAPKLFWERHTVRGHALWLCLSRQALLAALHALLPRLQRGYREVAVLEWRPPREQDVEHDAGGPQVGRLSVRTEPRRVHHLRSHVVGGAAGRSGPNQLSRRPTRRGPWADLTILGEQR
eukprot:scaffold6463_cov28-Tisochrysis_lutea.AAC.1